MRTAIVIQIDEQDVLRRGRAILAAGPLTGTYADCGAFCPWCAIAMAKGTLDREHGTDGDAPLVFARGALRPYREIDTNTLSQEGALEILDRAIADID